MRATDYAGRAVIVTGGTRGIGVEIARAFLRAGAQVLVCGRAEPGDGATLPGIPVSWRLLRLKCPRGDTTLLVARYPVPPPVCPGHGIALELDEAAL